MARPAPDGERCDLCRSGVPDDHRHLLQLEERRILCVCEPCRALRSRRRRAAAGRHAHAVAGGLRAARRRVGRVPDPDRARVLPALERDRQRRRDVPVAGRRDRERAALRRAGTRLVELNPVLRGLEPDAEGLIVDRRLGVAAIAPIDRCYELVGLIKSRWEGISGGRRRRARDRRVLRGAAVIEPRVRGPRRGRAAASRRCRRSTSTCT